MQLALRKEEEQVMIKELMTKDELANYLGIKPSSVDKLVRKGLPMLKLTGRLVRFRKESVDRWLDSMEVKDITATRMSYKQKVFQIKGKRGIYGWGSTIKKIKALGREKKIMLPKGMYPLYLLYEVLAVSEDIFIDLLERSAKEKVIELTPGRPTDIKKGSKVYQVLEKPYYSFIYKGLEEE